LRILIYGVYPDVHTESVAWALRQKGVEVDVWNQGNFPFQQKISVNIECETNRLAWHIDDFSLHAATSKYDVIWYRRPSTPSLADNINKADRDMASRESSSQLLGMDDIVGAGSRWINDPQANRKAANKIYQLKTAMECGLAFPPTLFSNSPEQIREFSNRHRQIIYKPFLQSHWQIGKGMRSLFTSKIQADQLKNDASLSACPGIFQKCIEKKHEIRLTIMGETIIPVKIYGYPNELAALDWRSAATSGIQYELVDLPAAVIEKSRALMEKLGLSFACLDFIVDEDENYHFLEANPAGQFLWVEDNLPHVPMLDLFCNFLISSAQPDAARQVKVTLAQFDAYEQEKGQAADSGPQHKRYQNPFLYSET
jgi:glutathione synthase/RimK-type ligase-like ATP-grasp enzyme